MNVGQLAGFAPSKRQPVPGTRNIWQGTEKLMEGVRMLETLEQSGMINQIAWSGVEK
ncbi:MAG: hypothetical protein OXI60_10100 [Acidiferrobacterales bacterium]|nr:hypothetical protein [Acidiferrobacterales bacterium]